MNTSRKINQGGIFWITPDAAGESELGYYQHPDVVIQDNVLNQRRLNTVVVCALTSNLRQAKDPDNMPLEIGEANLPKKSVIVVSKVSSVNKTLLGEYIGSLTEQRIKQVFAGRQFLQKSYFCR